MTTLKDKIRDIVMEHHVLIRKEKDVSPDPEVLVDAIVDEISDYVSEILQ